MEKEREECKLNDSSSGGMSEIKHSNGKPPPPPPPQYCVMVNGNQAASQRFIKEVCAAEVGNQVDYGEHLVTCDEELVAIQHLRRLVLCNVRLTAIDLFMGRLHMLTHVNLSFNRITDVSSVSLLSGLHVLDISHNKIVSIDAVRELTSLHTLRCHQNAIESLEPLLSLSNLSELWISDNGLVWQEFICLMPLSKLKALVKVGNPSDGKDKLNAFVKALRPSLRSLDGVDVLFETGARPCALCPVPHACPVHYVRCGLWCVWVRALI